MSVDRVAERAGAWVWVSALQFYVAQVAVAAAWTQPYRITERYISDLGNTACAAYPTASHYFACSPLHGVMNASLVLIGFTMAIGAWLVAPVFSGRTGRVATALFVLAGCGSVTVGVFPENTRGDLHFAGAALNIVAGNVALILYGIQWSVPRPGRAAFGLALGLAGLVGAVLFMQGLFAGIGPGGMERVAVYPTSIWQIVIGVSLLRDSWLGRRASIGAC